jgi:predicted amidophosphoribosyltransferase
MTNRVLLKNRLGFLVSKSRRVPPASHLFCESCGQSRKQIGELCEECYSATEWEREGTCGHCGRFGVFAKGRCRACYEYLNRTGRERPRHLTKREFVRRGPSWELDLLAGLKLPEAA